MPDKGVDQFIRRYGNTIPPISARTSIGYWVTHYTHTSKTYVSAVWLFDVGNNLPARDDISLKFSLNGDELLGLVSYCWYKKKKQSHKIEYGGIDMSADIDAWKAFLISQNIPFTIVGGCLAPGNNGNNTLEQMKLQSIQIGVKEDYDTEWDTPGYRKYFAGRPGDTHEVAIDIDFDLDGKFLRFDPFVDEAPIRVTDLKNTDTEEVRPWPIQILKSGQSFSNQ